MVHLHMKIQVLQSSIDKPPDTEIKDKCKTNIVLCTAVDLITSKEGKF